MYIIVELKLNLNVIIVCSNTYLQSCFIYIFNLTLRYIQLGE